MVYLINSTIFNMDDNRNEFKHIYRIQTLLRSYVFIYSRNRTDELSV